MCKQTKIFLHLANLLLNLQSVIRTNLLTQTQSFYLIFLLTYKIQPHVNIKPTYIHITLSRRIYTHNFKEKTILKTSGKRLVRLINFIVQTEFLKIFIEADLKTRGKLFFMC